jgi:hypothetical protein
LAEFRRSNFFQRWTTGAALISIHFRTLLRVISSARAINVMVLRIPLKAIGHSRGKPITVPGGNRSGVGAKRRWLFDVAKPDRNRQAKSVRSEAKAGFR